MKENILLYGFVGQVEQVMDECAQGEMGHQGLEKKSLYEVIGCLGSKILECEMETDNVPKCLRAVVALAGSYDKQ